MNEHSAEKDVGRRERLARWVCSWWGHSPCFYEEFDGTLRGICLRCGATPPSVTPPG